MAWRPITSCAVRAAKLAQWPRTPPAAARARPLSRVLPLNVDIHSRPEHAAICSSQGSRVPRGSPLLVFDVVMTIGDVLARSHRPQHECGSRLPDAPTAARMASRLRLMVQCLRPLPACRALWAHLVPAPIRLLERHASARLRARAGSPGLVRSFRRGFGGDPVRKPCQHR